MNAINQSQAASSHINQTDTGLAFLRNEIDASITIVRSDMNTNKSKVAAVQNEIASISEIIKKGKQDKTEEATVLAVKKSKLQEEK